MAKSNDQKPRGNENDFTETQSDFDKAKNERLKDETGDGTDKDKNDSTTKTDTARKKTGGGKQVNPGM
jgi:hypothetical protein